jgi:LuxR family maltose regulon positive regulatory protein
VVDGGNAPLVQFTEREYEILIFLANGFSDREIASKLFLSLNTIKWYNRKIYAKLSVCTRTQAVARAYQLNLLEAKLPIESLHHFQGDPKITETGYT